MSRKTPHWDDEYISLDAIVLTDDTVLIGTNARRHYTPDVGHELYEISSAIQVKRNQVQGADVRFSGVLSPDKIARAYAAAEQELEGRLPDTVTAPSTSVIAFYVSVAELGRRG